MRDRLKEYLTRPVSRTTLLKGAGLAGAGALAAGPAAALAAGSDAVPAGGPTGAGSSPGLLPYVDGLENLRYNNPFGQVVNPAWAHGHKVFHFDLGATMIKPEYKIAQQYHAVYAEGFQLPMSVLQFLMAPLIGYEVYSAVPGDPEYSPIWHNYFVLVPQDYMTNSLRSVADIQTSGYPVVTSSIWVN